MSVIVYFQPNYAGPSTEIKASPTAYRLIKPLGSIRICQGTKVTFMTDNSSTAVQLPNMITPTTRGIGELGTYTGLITTIKVEKS
jgi:hypothetical protein